MDLSIGFEIIFSVFGNLFLTMQLIELNVPMVIALNMMDEVTQSGGSIDINGLEAALGVPVIPISASKNEGIETMRNCQDNENND